MYVDLSTTLPDMTPIFTEIVTTADSGGGTTQLVLSAVAYSQTGEQYYCQISYDENSDGAVSFTADAVTLYVRGKQLHSTRVLPQLRTQLTYAYY